MPRRRDARRTDAHFRTSLRNSHKDDFSPNLLKQIAAADAQKYIDSRNVIARQYQSEPATARNEDANDVGTATLPPLSNRKPTPEQAAGPQSRMSTSGLDMIGVNDRFVEAAGEARVDFVIQRLQDGQDVNHVHSLLGYTALHAAADVAGARGGVDLGQLEIVYLLLQHGCKLNIQARSNGETALHRAAASGRFKVVELLINYGCKTKIKDHQGQIPLQLANMYNRPKCAMLLREFPLSCRGLRSIEEGKRHVQVLWKPPRNFRQLACPVDTYKIRWRHVSHEYVQCFAAMKIQRFFSKYVSRNQALVFGATLSALSKHASLLVVAQFGSWITTEPIVADPSMDSSRQQTNISDESQKKSAKSICIQATLDNRSTQSLALENWRWRRGLLPAATYAIQVQAHNDRGWGKFCPEIHVRTQNDVPDAPENIEAEITLATEVEMAFDAPRANCTPAEISHFDVQRKILDSVSSLVSREIGSWLDCPDEIPGQQELSRSHMRICDLNPSTTYLFRARAVTVVGVSDWSTPSRPVRTKDAPYLVAATPNSITVKWAVPEGVAPACYHLQKSLVSENELDEGPWESAISGSDDETGAVEANLGMPITACNTPSAHDSLRLTVVTSTSYTACGLLANRKYKFRVKFWDSRTAQWSRFDPKDQSLWLATSAHIPDGPIAPMLCQSTNFWIPDRNYELTTSSIHGSHLATISPRSVMLQGSLPNERGSAIERVELEYRCLGRFTVEDLVAIPNTVSPIKLDRDYAAGLSFSRYTQVYVKDHSECSVITDTAVSEDVSSHASWFMFHRSLNLVVVRVQGLQPGVRVVFRVRYRNGVGWSCWSRPSASIDTSPAVPDTPMACSVAAKVPKFAQLLITAPHHNGALIRRIQIQRRQVHAGLLWDEDGSWETDQVVDRHPGWRRAQQCTVHVGPLRSGSCWQFRVRALNACGWGTFSEASSPIRLMLDVPDAPRPVVLVKATTSCHILQWEPCCDNGSVVDAYEVERRLVHIPDGGVSTYPLLADPKTRSWHVAAVINHNTLPGVHSTTINDLVAGTSWTYRVRAHNAEGWGGHSLQSPVFAVLPTTPSAPGRPDALNISEYTLTLKWALPCDHGEQLVGHLLEMAVVPQDHDAVVLHSWVEVSRLLPDPTRYLQGLNPGTSYIFRAKARNSLGWGPFSEPSSVITTRPAAPMRPMPPVRMNFESRSIMLRWMPPACNGSPVVRYELLLYRTYVEKGTDGAVVMKAPPPDHPGTFRQWIVPELCQSGNAAPLYEGDHYGEDGGDDADEEQDTTTQGDTYGGGSVDDDTDSFTSALWSLSEDALSLRPAGIVPVRSLLLFDTQAMVRVRPMSRYQFKIRAWNNAGWSEWSKPSEPMITQAGNPDPPEPPELVFCTDSIIHVQWAPPNPCGSPIDGFELQQKEVRASDTVSSNDATAWDRAPWETVGANFSECQYITCELSSVFVYKFRVRAHNFEGWSQWSPASSSMRTKRRF